MISMILLWISSNAVLTFTEKKNNPGTTLTLFSQITITTPVSDCMKVLLKLLVVKHKFERITKQQPPSSLQSDKPTQFGTREQIVRGKPVNILEYSAAQEQNVSPCECEETKSKR